MMPKDPAILFYVQDFLIGSSLFTPLQKGHYITLLCYQQQSESGSIPLSQIKTLMRSDFTKHWPVLMLKFQVDGNGYFNERMRQEIARRRKYSESRSSNRRPKSETHVDHMEEHMLPHMETETENEIPVFKKGGMGGIEISLKIDLPQSVLTAAEENQNIHTRKKNTEFIQSQWKVFLSERMSEPEKKFHRMSDLTSYFLNWIRPKFPKNGTHLKTPSGTKRDNANHFAEQALSEFESIAGRAKNP